MTSHGILPNLKPGAGIFLAVALLVAFLWARPATPAPVPGQVENQIRGFGPEMAHRLAQAQTFDRVDTGYRPHPEVPQAPAGLKPVEAQAWNAMAAREVAVDRRTTVFSPVFPDHYSDGTQVRGLGMAVTLRPLHSTSAQAQIEKGKLVYHGAYAATDSLQVAGTGRSEEFLLLHDASAPQRFEYELTGVEGVKAISLKDGAIHFRNDKGQELLVEAPWLVESQSVAAVYDRRSPQASADPSRSRERKRVDAEVAVDRRATVGMTPDKKTSVILSLSKDQLPANLAIQERLRLGNPATPDPRAHAGGTPATPATLVHWELVPAGKGAAWPRLALVVNDAKALRYPVVIDPSWTTTLGQLNTARIYHTATLLNNGQVLVAGGTSDSAGLDCLSSAELYNPATGTWTVTGSLHTARAYHSATLLLNGKVLVAGGYDGTNFSATCELYDPSTGTWSVTGNLNFARGAHTATLLGNGKVLATGGENDSAPLASAELFNPATGTWSQTGNMASARDLHTAALLPNGDVLVAGGRNSTTNGLTGTELYSPGTGTWTATGSLNVGRVSFTATLMPNGQVLAVAGATQGSSNNTAELYNPATGSWTLTGSLPISQDFGFDATLLPSGQVLVGSGFAVELYNPSTGTWTTGSSMITPRLFQNMTLLSNGEVLITGGVDGNTGEIVLASTELYDSSSASWSVTGNLNTVREFHSTTLLPSGKILVAGGFNFSSGAIASAELYDPSNGNWTATGNLNTARDSHTTTLLPNGSVLVTGGFNGSASLSNSELYNPTTGDWTTTGNLNTARDRHTATLLPDGNVLVAGGFDGSSYLNGAELYDPATGSWTATGNLNAARGNHTATLLSNGNVLVSGGFYDSTYLNSAELYNPATGSWTATGNLNTARGYHTATLLPNGKVLVAGGDGMVGGALASSELYNPATGTWAFTGNLNTGRYYHSASLLTNGHVLVVGGLNINYGYIPVAESYDPATGIWTSTGSLNIPRYAHTATLLPSGQIMVSGGSNGEVLSSSELFDPGLGYTPATQPVFTSTGEINSSLGQTLHGTGFMGVSEASGGGTNNSGSKIPVVVLQSLVNEQTYTMALDPTQAFMSELFNPENMALQAVPATSFPPGYALMTMFVNGTPSASQIVTFNPVTQTLAPSGTTTTLSFGQLPYFPSTTLFNQATSSLPVTYSLISGPATLSGSTLTFTGVGTVIVQAYVAGNATYSPASTTDTFTITPGPQWINFPAIANQTYGGAALPLSATASSGLPVTFSLVSGPASLSGSTLTFTGAGMVTVSASQAGNANYAAATSVSETIDVTPASQTIAAFTTIPGQVYGVGPITITPPVASSCLPVTVTVQSGPATISGNQVTITGGGTVVLAADQAGNTNYSAASEVTTSFTVSPASQPITFPTITGVYGQTVALTASSCSGLPITYSVISGLATVNNTNDTVTFTGAGAVVLAADQAGNANYATATEVQQTVTVGVASQSISVFGSIPTQPYGDPRPLTITPPTASSGLPVTVTVQSGPATISGNQVTLTGVGIVVLAADQAGNANYSAAAELTTSFTVSPAPQMITFPAITGIYNQTVALNASSTSGLPITYGVISGPATVNNTNDTVTFTGAGAVILAADQAGNTNYNAAVEATRNFTVSPAPQTITFPAMSGIYNQTATLSASATSGLPIAYRVISGSATINYTNDTVTFTGVGTVVLAADQGGNANYTAATEVQQTVTVGQATQTLSFATIGNQTFGTAPLTLDAAASSGLPVYYTTAGPVKISGNVATITGAGSVLIRAHQDGNADYAAAPSVLSTFTVNPAAQAITFSPVSNKTFGTGPFHVAATTSSGLLATYRVVSGPATLAGNLVTITGLGTVVLGADQAGNADYLPAKEVTTSFTVGLPTQTITFPAIANQVVGATFTLEATSSSGLPISYSKSGPVKISGTKATVTGVGSVLIGASQAGNADYAAAAEVRRSFTVTAAGSGG